MAPDPLVLLRTVTAIAAMIVMVPNVIPSIPWAFLQQSRTLGSRSLRFPTACPSSHRVSCFQVAYSNLHLPVRIKLLNHCSSGAPAFLESHTSAAISRHANRKCVCPGVKDFRDGFVFLSFWWGLWVSVAGVFVSTSLSTSQLYACS